MMKKKLLIIGFLILLIGCSEPESLDGKIVWDINKDVLGVYQILNDVNVSMFHAGDLLFISSDEPGVVTNVKPEDQDYVDSIGYVLSSDEQGVLALYIIGRNQKEEKNEGECIIPKEGCKYYTVFGEVRNITTSHKV